MFTLSLEVLEMQFLLALAYVCAHMCMRTGAYVHAALFFLVMLIDLFCFVVSVKQHELAA